MSELKKLCTNITEPLSQEDIKDMNDEDIVVFMPSTGNGVCLDKDMLLQFWEGGHGDAWVWGECKGSEVNIEAHPERVCRKFYKLPALEMFLYEEVVKMFKERKDVVIWKINNYGDKVTLGRNMHVVGELNRNNQEIFGICPEGETCSKPIYNRPRNLEVEKKQFLDAVRQNNIDEVKTLVENGIDVNIDDNKALYIAVEKGNLNMVKYLINIGSNYNQNYNFGSLQLSNDILSSDLLQKIRERNIKFFLNKNQETTTLIFDENDTWKIMLELTVHANYENIDIFESVEGFTIVDVAILNNRIDILNYLFGHDIDLAMDNDILTLSIQSENIDIVKFLLEEKFSPSEPENLPIITAISNDNLEIVKLLLEYKVKLNDNIMNLALEYQNPDIIEEISYEMAIRRRNARNN